MPKPGRQFLIRIALLAIVGSFGVYQYRKYRVAPDLSIEDLRVETLNGESVTLTPSKKGLLIIKFFATWCIDCRRELPMLVDNSELFKRYAIELILLSDENAGDLQFFSTRENLPFTIYRLPKKFKDYGVNTLPTTFVFSSNGERILQYTGSKELSEDFLKTISARE
jgi:thiol-disulfide isomerase/thioredoxin